MSVIRFPTKLRLVKPEENQQDIADRMKTIDVASMRRGLLRLEKEIKLTKAKLRLRIVDNEKEGTDK